MPPPAILYSCPFVPAEWILAHGLRPWRIQPPSAALMGRSAAPEGVCPYAHAFLCALEDSEASGAIFTTVCDQMRRAAECTNPDTPTFLMHVPNTWQTPAAHRLYADEVRRLGRFLERLGGAAPSGERLAEVMRERDAARYALLARRASLSPRRFSESIAAFHAGEPLERNGCETLVAAQQAGVAIGLIGGPLLADAFDLFDAIERAGASVALDGTETGERTMAARFDRRRLVDDPFSELMEAYFGSIPDVARRPNSGFYQWLRGEIEARALWGLILVRYSWCDFWHAEAARIKEWAPVPTLDLDLGSGDDAGTASRVATRIGAFVEMLR